MLSSGSIDSPAERAASLIEQAEALIVAAGAEIGVDSGLPDFRGKDGFWQAYPPGKGWCRLPQHRITEAFLSQPERAWGFSTYSAVRGPSIWGGASIK